MEKGMKQTKFLRLLTEFFTNHPEVKTIDYMSFTGKAHSPYKNRQSILYIESPDVQRAIYYNMDIGEIV